MLPRVLALSVAIGLGLACGSVTGSEVGAADAAEFADWDAAPIGIDMDGGFPGLDDAATPTMLDDAGTTTPQVDAGSEQGCPPCAADETCDEVYFVCVKKVACGDAGVETVTCASTGVQCGGFTYLDRCDGRLRTLACGVCPGAQACVAGRCRCQSESDADLCLAAGATCGEATAVDRCGELRTVRCGACGFGEVCVPETRDCRLLTACAAGGCPPDAPYCRSDGFCVECVGSGACGTGRVCAPELNLCLQCLQDSDCQPAGGRCQAGSGTCVECLVGADCDSGLCGAGNACLPPPPGNDGCAGALAVAVAAPPISHDLARARSDATASCGADGPDVAFALQVPSAGPYTITVTPADPLLRPTVSVRARCAEPGTELGCVEADAPGKQAVLEARLPAGLATVWVDAGGAGQGAFTLEVVAGPTPTAPASDTCAGAEPLTLVPGADDRWRATAAGSTVSAQDDSAGSCAYSDGPDVVYALRLAGESKVTAVVTSDGSVLAYQPSVYLRGPGAAADACEAYSAEVACSLGAGGGAATAVAGRLPAGDYYVVVDGATGGAGGFALSVDVEPPLPMADGCDGFSFTAPEAGQKVSFAADTTAATNRAEGACGGSGPDALYAFTLGAPARLSFSLAATGAGQPLRPLFYLRQGTCGSVDPADELACVVPGVAGEHVASTTLDLPAGDWWLWVDGFGGSRGPYTLEVSRP